MGTVSPNYVTRWRYIVAIVPYYQVDGRNATMVMYEDGSVEEYDKKCISLVKDLTVKAFCTSMDVARRRAEVILTEGGQRKQPLALREDFCLVQLRCRKEKGRNSGALCYVVLQYIKDVECSSDGYSRIRFYQNAAPLYIRQKKSSVIRQIKLAWQLQIKLAEEKQYWAVHTKLAAQQLCEKAQKMNNADLAAQYIWQQQTTADGKQQQESLAEQMLAKAEKRTLRRQSEPETLEEFLRKAEAKRQK